MTRHLDLTGRRFGRLVALERAARSANGKARWRCRCDCGREFITAGLYLRGGQTKSCGCLRSEKGRIVIEARRRHLAEVRIDKAGEFALAGFALLGREARRRALQVRLRPDDPLARRLQVMVSCGSFVL